MNIKETLQALEAKSIITALDIGEHGRCDISSNCPVAIQLRKVISESQITLPELMEGLSTVTAAPLTNMELENITGELELNVAGKSIKIDMLDVIKEQVRAGVMARIRTINAQQERLAGLGISLYNTYLDGIANARRTKKLSQYQASIFGLIKYKVMVTEDHGNYVFLFDTEYHPDCYIRDGVRSKLSKRHEEQIRQEAYLKITVSVEGRIISTLLLNKIGEKLVHYHGNSNSDCWGTVVFSMPTGIPTLENLYRVKVMAMGSLATINMNSLMSREPTNMPTAVQLEEEGTRLGREGEMVEVAGRDGLAVGWNQHTETVPVRPTWGRRA